MLSRIITVLLACSMIHTSSQYKAELTDYVSKVPAYILSDLKAADYQITLSDQPGESYGVKYIDGITDTDNNLIIIKDYDGKFEKTVVHEIGHAFDDCMDFPSKSNVFLKIYESEKSCMSGHYATNAQEYFAASFNLYIYDGQALRQSAPMTYKFIRRCCRCAKKSTIHRAI